MKQKVIGFLLTVSLLVQLCTFGAFADTVKIPWKTSNSSEEKVLIFDEMVYFDNIWTDKQYDGVIQMPDGNSVENRNYYGDDLTPLINCLKYQLVGQAVTKLMTTFDDAFGYLEGSDTEIGLNLFNDPYSAVAAQTAQRVQMFTDGSAQVNYMLSVNLAHLDISKDGMTIEEESFEELESNIVHEFMHAMMYEAHTCGMLGYDYNLNRSTGFPLWFNEGTAQVAGGGYDWVSSCYLSGSSSEVEIENVLARNPLSDRSNATSAYMSGYLAVMYLGYLSSRSTTIDPIAIADGVDKILEHVRKGNSLDAAFNKFTYGKYSSVADFEANFSHDGAAFVKRLIAEMEKGSDPLGALVTGNLSDEDILDNTREYFQSLFQLTPEYKSVNNVYPPNYPTMSGGTLSDTLNNPLGDPAAYHGVHLIDKWLYYDENKHYADCTVCGKRLYDDHHWGEGLLLRYPIPNHPGTLIHFCQECDAYWLEPTNDYPVYNCGDVDGNGVVTLNDAMNIINYVAKKDKLTGDYLARCDVDFNDEIVLNDAMYIINFVAKKADKVGPLG